MVRKAEGRDTRATGELGPDTALTGRYEESGRPADVRGVMGDVDAARRWHERNGQ